MLDSLIGELESDGDDPCDPRGGGEACGMLPTRRVTRN